MTDQDSSGRPFEVGYGKPPRHKPIRQREIRQPKGRGKGVRNFSTEIQDELNTRIPIMENGKRKKVTKRKAVAKQLVNKAASGDPKAIPVLLNEARQHEAGSAAGLGHDALCRRKTSWLWRTSLGASEKSSADVRISAKNRRPTTAIRRLLSQKQEQPMMLSPSEYRFILRNDLMSFIERAFYELTHRLKFLHGPHIEMIASKLEACLQARSGRLIINQHRAVSNHTAPVLHFLPGTSAITQPDNSFAQVMGKI